MKQFGGAKSSDGLTSWRPKILGAHGFAHDGRTYASDTGRQEVTVWDLTTGVPLSKLISPGLTVDLAFGPDDSRIAVLVESGDVALFDRTGRLVQLLRATDARSHEYSVPGVLPFAHERTVIFSSDGLKAVTWQVTNEGDGTIIRFRTWDAAKR